MSKDKTFNQEAFNYVIDNYGETLKELAKMEVDVELLNKWVSLTGARARLEADLFEGAIVYMNEEGQIVKENFDRSIEIIEEADRER